MKILFAQSYQRFLDPKEAKRGMPYPPLGALYAATGLSALGHTIRFVDGMFTNSVDEFREAVRTFRPDICFIYDDEFNYLTKMCLSNMRDAAFRMIQDAREAGVPVFVYSSDAADYHESYLATGADAVILGEGETAVWELTFLLQSGKWEAMRSEVAGIVFRKGETSVKTSKREVIRNLDQLPKPNYDLIDVERYAQEWRSRYGYFSLNVSTSRGCPYHCNWCAKPLYGQVYYVNSPEWVAGEFERLHSSYNINHIWVTDDIFGLKPDWLRRFADAIVAKNLPIQFKCLSRADLLIRDDSILQLKRAGCETVWLGAESGSQKILDAMEKGTKVHQIYEATARLRQNKISSAYFIQFGYLGEQWEDIQMTRKMIRDNLPEELGISVSYPLPGTKFYERVRAELHEKRHWRDSDDLDLMIPGAFSKKFYKILHRFVHAEYRLLRLIRRREWGRVVRGSYYFVKYVYSALRMIPHLKRNPLTTSVG